MVVRPKRDLPDLSEELLKIIREELNVKEIAFEEDLQKYYVPVVEPDFSKLGPKFESDAQLVGDLVKKKDNEAIANLLEGQGEFQVESEDESFKVTKSDVTISYEPGEDYAEVEGRKYDLLLDLSLDEELLEEGYVRELIRRIQQLRKEAGFEVTDRIELFFRADSKVNRAIEKHSEYLKSETLAQSLSLDELPDEVDITKQESLNGKEATIALNRIS
ncbi:MAG: DUF5915 domain-containing protein [Candidatus Bipolaricaulota bacterium]